MFEIFKSSVEYTKLGNALDKAFSNGMALMVQVERSPEKLHSKSLLIAHCHFVRTEIYQRIDVNKWPLDRKIICLKIKVGRVTLAEAYQAILTQVFIMANNIGCTDEVSAILE